MKLTVTMNPSKRGLNMIFNTKTVDYTNRDEMIAFLTNHFRYSTMNSWNQMTSYANNVKLHNLGIPSDIYSKAFDFLYAECFDYNDDVDNLIYDFRAETGYTAGFNGRSGGYIVMYETELDKKGRRVTMMRSIDQYEDFEDWETEDIAERVKLVQKFDQLCDDIRDLFIYYVNNVTLKNVEVIHTEVKRVAVFDEDNETEE